MEQSIASLSPQQAQRALLIFYDLLPADLWEGSKKPSAAKIESTVEKLQEEMTEDVRPVVQALLNAGGEGEKGGAAKAVLNMFYEKQSLRGFVEQAVRQAQQPHMSPIPLMFGEVAILLAAMPKDVDQANGQWKSGHLRDAAALMREFSQFTSTLPADISKGFTKGGS
jgi:hypothetical protein